jgi:transcriptional regulator with XRE-family HTH domain
MVTPAQRTELADFLRARRVRVLRSMLGLPPARSGREHGVSREEVAVLAGMSVTWYTWLEQGRTINPSRQVIDALARVLSLSEVEHHFVLNLLGFAPPTLEDTAGHAMPEHVQRLLDGITGFPAFAVAADWTVVGWNSVYAMLYPRIVDVPEATRNLLWLVFTDPYVREMLPDWEKDSRCFVAEFRADAGAWLEDQNVVRLISELQTASPEFAAVWRDHEVQRFASRERRFHHRAVGDLVFEHQRLSPTDTPGLHLIVYSPAPGYGTEERLAALLRT